MTIIQSQPSAQESRAFMVDRIDQVTSEAVAITLSSADGMPMPFRSGQYVSLTVRFPDGTRMTRSYSIASAPGQLASGSIKIGVKRIKGGQVSTYLTEQLQVGEGMEIRGPLGDFGPPMHRTAKEPLLLIAGGSGITPLLSIALSTLTEDSTRPVMLMYRARSEASIMFKADIEHLRLRHPGRFTYVPLLSLGGASPFEGWRHVLAAEPQLAQVHDIYICGPQGLMDEAKSTLLALGHGAESIHIEQFDRQNSPTAQGAKTWTMTIRQGAAESICAVTEGESVLDAVEQAGYAVSNSCRVGSCGSCKVKVLEGTTSALDVVGQQTDGMAHPQVLSCVCTPSSDVTIELPELDQAVDAHPAVVRWFKNPTRHNRQTISKDELKQLAMACGADDAGFAAVDRADLAAEWPHLARAFPKGRTYVCLVRRMNTANVRSPERSIANADFHHTMDDIQHIARRFADALTERGIKTFCAPPAFPMEMDRFPERGWVIAHKTIAEATGMGRIGLHRNVIHPRFGNFILLDTVVIDRDVDVEDSPLDENPCIGCNLCVVACPVGAINTDGHFDFTACYTHNYREFMSGFSNWVEQVADSKSAKDYRSKVTDSETVSMWQSLSFGPNYKAAYCLSVCPAGSDVIGDFLANRKQFVNDVLVPLQDKSEPIYVVPGSDAERFVKKKYPHKPVRRVSNGLRVRNIQGFLNGLRISFQRGKAGNLSATYHFTFIGEEPTQATVKISNKKIEVIPELVGRADLRVTTDSSAWLRFVRKESSLFSILATRKLRLKGSPQLLAAFGRCFL